MRRLIVSTLFLCSGFILTLTPIGCDSPPDEETPTPTQTPTPSVSPTPMPTQTPPPDASPTPDDGPSPSEPPSTPGPTDSPLCASSSGDEPSDPFIDCVVSYDPPLAPEDMYGYDSFPEVVFGSPEGDEDGGGSTDVLSLGCGGTIEVYFEWPAIVDGEGADFIVFENPFYYGETTFAEPAQVSVSEDGVEWVTFPCEVDGQGTWPPTGCAGVYPVYAGSSNDLDPTDPEVAGGDAFDLATVGLEKARYIRLEDRTVEYYGDETWCGTSGGFDLDAISIVNQEPLD